MRPAQHSIVIDQGADFRLFFTWKTDNGAPIDLTGFTAKMQGRPEPESESTLFDLAVGSGIILGGAAGTFDARLSGSITGALVRPESAVIAVIGKRTVYQIGFYDVTATNGQLIRLLEGRVFLSLGVTR